MEQETQTQEVQQVEQTSTEPAGLEDVYKEFNVAPYEQPKEPQQAQQQQPQQPQQLVVPDPALDPEGHKTFMRSHFAEQEQFKGALKTLTQHIQHEQLERVRAAEKADIKKAVDLVNTKLKADDDFAEIAIAQKVNKDPKFRALWQNRSQNPQAFEAGMKALGTELSKKFEFRVDPQLTENQRAMKEATQTKAQGAPQESVVDQLGKLTGRDFDAAVERMRNQPSY